MSDIQLLVAQTNATVVDVSETWLYSDLVSNVIVSRYSLVPGWREGGFCGG